MKAAGAGTPTALCFHPCLTQRKNVIDSTTFKAIVQIMSQLPVGRFAALITAFVIWALAPAITAWIQHH